MRPVEYIKIIDLGIQPGKKTKHLEVRSKKTDFLLGTIKWYAPWRQYALYPDGTSILNPDCMMAISKRCQAETSLHKSKGSREQKRS